MAAQHTPAPPLPSQKVTDMDTVPEEKLDWLWRPRIARGKLTLLIGDPGLGKSWLLLDLMARLSRGGAWPELCAFPPASHSLFLADEDGLADTIVPRLMGLNADMGMIHCLEGVYPEPGGRLRHFNLETDLANLEAALVQTGAIFLAIDPLTSYLGNVNSIRDPEVREVLTPLVELAERRHIALVATMHLNKDSELRALYRAQGSIAFVALARSVLAVAPHPDNPDKRVLLHGKNNLDRIAPTLTFDLDGGVFTWGSAPEAFGFEEVYAKQRKAEHSDGGNTLHLAQAFLQTFLAQGAKPTDEIIARGTAVGISERTLWRAKKAMNLKAFRVGIGGPGSHWCWRIPDDQQDPPTWVTDNGQP